MREIVRGAIRDLMSAGAVEKARQADLRGKRKLMEMAQRLEKEGER
jgi:hypothetical protein